MEDKTLIVIATIFAITLLETVALCNEINGVLFSGVIIVLAGLGGYSSPALVDGIKQKIIPR